MQAETYIAYQWKCECRTWDYEHEKQHTAKCSNCGKVNDLVYGSDILVKNVDVELLKEQCRIVDKVRNNQLLYQNELNELTGLIELLDTIIIQGEE